MQISSANGLNYSLKSPTDSILADLAAKYPDQPPFVIKLKAEQYTTVSLNYGTQITLEHGNDENKYKYDIVLNYLFKVSYYHRLFSALEEYILTSYKCIISRE